ncbi:hypothetical protein TNCV_3839081 [Trichonephila clavipes]|nr:hypothetical protein TNCV_3839081 [Trichonephila clavipes]
MCRLQEGFCAGDKVILYLSLLSPCFSCSSSGLLRHFPETVVRGARPGIDFITVPSSIKYRKLIVDLLERLDASNLTAKLTAHAAGSSISNEVTLEFDSHSDSKTESIYTQNPLSVAEELDKVIKEGYAPMQFIRVETMS